MVDKKLVSILRQKTFKKSLSTEQMRFAIETFERVLNTDEVVMVRRSGTMIRVDPYEKKSGQSV